MESNIEKVEKLKIEDTNLANFGTDLEMKIKKAASETEPEWQTAGKESGLLVWRIEKFNVRKWASELYGSFYSGDSYIVLSTTKTEEGKLNWDIHMWYTLFLAATALFDDDGGTDRGAFYVLFMNSDGYVKDHNVITHPQPNPLTRFDAFGSS